MALLSIFFYLAQIPEIFSWLIFLAIIFIAGMDYASLFQIQEGMEAHRDLSELLSNGDENPVQITLYNHYNFTINYQLIEELPFQLQIRNFNYSGKITAVQQATIKYNIRPTKRGEYSFGATLVYIMGPLGLLKRRMDFNHSMTLPCYPSIIQMKKYAHLAVSRFASSYGIKNVRRLGHSMEFEQIKDYTLGDDIRTLNWKATARKGSLMVNHYVDEKSQPIYCIIDKGRAMRQLFEGLSLMDYAINSTLAFANIALQKGDKIGLITYGDKPGTYLPAGQGSNQLKKLLTALYNQKTSWGESSGEFMYTVVREQVNQRSLIIVFSEFDTIQSLERQLPYLRRLSRFHLVLLVFFEDTELEIKLKTPVHSVKDIYLKTISAKFSLEKTLIVKELNRNGILALLTKPNELSVSLINQYLEIKNRGRL